MVSQRSEFLSIFLYFGKDGGGGLVGALFRRDRVIISVER